MKLMDIFDGIYWIHGTSGTYRKRESKVMMDFLFVIQGTRIHHSTFFYPIYYLKMKKIKFVNQTKELKYSWGKSLLVKQKKIDNWGQLFFSLFPLSFTPLYLLPLPRLFGNATIIVADQREILCVLLAACCMLYIFSLLLCVSPMSYRNLQSSFFILPANISDDKT